VEYSWDIWNMMDGFIIRIFVGTLAYSYDIQHLGNIKIVVLLIG